TKAMPPKSKKKKTKLSNPARGFATTSIPKQTETQPTLEEASKESGEHATVEDTLLPSLQVQNEETCPPSSEDNETLDTAIVSQLVKLSAIGTRKADAYFSQSSHLNADELPTLKLESNIEHEAIALLKETNENIFGN